MGGTRRLRSLGIRSLTMTFKGILIGIVIGVVVSIITHHIERRLYKDT